MFLNFNPGCLGFGEIFLGERIRIARDCGFGGLDVPLDGLTEQTAGIARRQIAEAHLQCGLFWLPCDLSSADDATFNQCALRLPSLAAIARLVGLSRTYCHVWSSSDQRPFDRNWKWHVDRLRRTRDILLPCGIELGIEFLGPHHLRTMARHSFIHDLDGALELICAVGEGCGLVLDTFHWYCSGGTLEELPAKLAQTRIICVHTNDATPGRSRQQQLDGERALPTETGLIDTRAMLAILKTLRCDAPVIVEPFQPWTGRFATMGVEAAARQVAQLMRPLLA